MSKEAMAFEEWMASSNYPEIADIALAKLPDGNYRSQLTFAAWQAWQAAIAALSVPALEDMAAVGRSLMETLHDNRASLTWWVCADSPAEIVVDCLNRIYDMEREHQTAITALEARIKELKATLTDARDVIVGPKSWRGMLADQNEVRQTVLTRIASALGDPA